MADFSAVSVSLTDPATLALTGQAVVTSDVPVHVSSVVTTDDGSTETLETDGTRSHTGPVATKLSSVTDDQGGSWTVSEDGQSAHLA